MWTTVDECVVLNIMLETRVFFGVFNQNGALQARVFTSLDVTFCSIVCCSAEIALPNNCLRHNNKGE